MTRPELPFLVAPIGAALLLTLSLGLGGGWIVVGLGWLMVLSAGHPKLAAWSAEPVGARGLAPLLALMHLPLLFAAIGVLSTLPFGLPWLGLFLLAGLYFGQVSVPVAHELIHASDRWRFRAGVMVFSSLLFGHHASAHRLVHHAYVGTERDPNSAPRGMSVYAFLPAAALGSFLAGLAAERQRGNQRVYGWYLGVSGAVLLFSFALFGWPGLGLHIALAVYSVLQLLVTDYVQHYGLRRHAHEGRIEPVGPQHSWDAPQQGAAWLMLNAPRHAGHHMKPQDQFGALSTSGATPVLPHSLAIMGALAFFPSRWARIMHPRLDRLTSE